MNTHTSHSTVHEKKSKRGGKRTGAGRPKGSGKWKETTKSIRLPLSLFESAQHLKNHYIQPQQEALSQPVPLFSSTVHAGFLSPADDHVEDKLNLHDYAVRHEKSTFFLRVRGNSMEGASIHDGDLLVVDRSIPPKTGDIIIVALRGELAVKRLFIEANGIVLRAENPSYAPIRVQGEEELLIWGVVTFVVHKTRA